MLPTRCLRQQPGLRAGLLVTDQRTLVYSPTPLLIEAGSPSEEKPNAIVISRDAEPTAALLHACETSGAGDAPTPPSRQAEVGREAATPSQVNEALAALKAVLPRKFTVARTERVYTAMIQFVELEVTCYRLSAKQVTIPNDLLIGDEYEFTGRLRNKFCLLKEEQTVKVSIPVFDPATAKPRPAESGSQVATEVWPEATLEAQRTALYRDFLIAVPRYAACDHAA